LKSVAERVAEFTEARRVMAMGLYPYFREIEGEQGTIVTMNGKSVLMMGSNNYLGLTDHPEVKAAAQKAIDQYGTGCAGSRFLNGTLSIHTECEEVLADFMGTEASLVYSTGFMANQGVISALVGRDSYIIIDKADHASIIDAARLAYGKTIKYAHNDMEDLEKKLSALSGKLCIIVIDGVFSMEGDIAKLPEICDIAEKYNAEVIVDDAHAIGVIGENGTGTASHFGIGDKILGTIGTFSKALASIGGFIASSENIIHFLRHHSRALIFSASPPPAGVAAVIKAVEIIKREPERIERLMELTAYLRNALKQANFNIGQSETPIIPIYVGEEMNAFKACMMLQAEGVFVNPVISPAVPPDKSLLRLSLMSTLTEENLDFAMEKLIKVGKTLGFI